MAGKVRSTSFRSIVEPRFQDGGRVAAQPRERERQRLQVLRRAEGVNRLAAAPDVLPGFTGVPGATHAQDMLREAAAWLDTAGLDFQGQSSESDLEQLRRHIQLDPTIRDMHMKMLAREGGPELVEEKMNEHARDHDEEGGRVVEYSGGALEWVPNGPGGQPQPTTGETFYDPIADAQHRVQTEETMRLTPRSSADFLDEWRPPSQRASWDPQEQRVIHRAKGGIVRSESERAYQDGGMVNEIIERSTNPEPGENLSQMIIRNRDDAMARLRAGQDAIAQRRAAQQQRDESSRWLALAQGMLSPTQTGGFGESLGTTAGLLRQEQEMARGHEGERIEEEMLLAKQEGDIQDDYIDQLQAQQRIEKEVNQGEYSRARPIGVAQLVPHPEDPSKLARVQQIWRPQLEEQAKDGSGQPMFDENGEPIMRRGVTEWQYVDEVGPDGSIPFAASALETERAREIALQRGLGEDLANRINEDIVGGRAAWPVIQKYEITMALMEEVEAEGLGTGGWVDLLQNVSEWWGVDSEGVTRMGELRNRLGQAVLEGLQHFPGQISEGERKYMERLESGIGHSLGVNMALIEEGLRVYRQIYRRGLAAAREIGSNYDLLQMGIDPNAPPGTAPAASPQGRDQRVPGSTKNNPLDAVAGAPPPAGTWIRLPNGDVMRYPGAGEEVPPAGLQLTQAPAVSTGG